MATTSVPVVASTTLDIAGISVVTAAPDADDPRNGAIYNPASLAAAQPIWFHPLKDGRHLMVMARSWSAATPSGGIPGVYSAFDESTAPSWVAISGSSGSVDQVPGGAAITVSTPVDSVTITAAASRPPENLWLLYSAQINSEPAAILQRWFVADDGSVVCKAEEVLPASPTVTFDKGIQYASPYLLIYGTDEDGVLYRLRKGWGNIGFNKVSPIQHGAQLGQVWEYYTGSGYSQDATELGPIQDDLGSVGPVSFGYVGNLTVMSVVEARLIDTGLTMYSTHADTIAANSMVDRVGRIWTSTNGRPWMLSPFAPTELGATDDDTYQGGGLALQSQLGADPTALGGTNNAGIVYVSTQKVIAGSDSSLVNSWGVYPVTLVG